MSGDNYITKLMISSIEEIKTNKVNWPGHWKLKDKIKFFDGILVWLEKEQLYEQCQVIIDAKKKIKKI
tara:strand:+ start:4590 stop:4793 length:204 start_codon:yes stop_codon:yes gene_type:complete